MISNQVFVLECDFEATVTIIYANQSYVAYVKSTFYFPLYEVAP